MGASALYLGEVMHRRRRPVQHYLRYRLFSLLLDLDELDALDARLRLFSRGRFNLLSFHDADYGDGSGAALRPRIEALCAAVGAPLAGGAIRVLTMPRLLGFAFNPLSLFYCHDAAGRLRAIVYQVNNTFGERHEYVLPVDDTGRIVRQDCAKAFHVSPFLPMDLAYAFRIVPPGDRLVVGITVADAAGPVLIAAHTARRSALDDRALAGAVLTHPLLTIKVVAAIGWEALKLWLRRVPVHTHPARR